MIKNVKLTISDAVKQVLKNYPYMESFLIADCVNYSSLARKIMPAVQKLIGS